MAVSCKKFATYLHLTPDVDHAHAGLTRQGDAFQLGKRANEVLAGAGCSKRREIWQELNLREDLAHPPLQQTITRPPLPSEIKKIDPLLRQQ
ncbi:uncharacterized protein MELLADRAFT_74498 [Melampsora larici-populina 98AG31]|uniref:Uncharacterized protein n=1 Tax=Melampsora larici-populina (strain 98AG31 / pathotype 3-4-7) TaxID=747676 RepID=F4RFY5_MELLP|nr:uncharacterized protein MELLADRAFT_74498 [Melampsora larici-populina 98AG31]EGG08678.1 hypothetical protein MELLADRAFT_74498 [Melampsora larici-populina 98AG31]